ncbi:hypothetical protein A3F66_05440 [candidate division TM6 bacterium RIFCSPHIGHO2_12_FULL_32_22]|nr:MAG: hypothetical protein A3F66_05440 [candidate division TM6 bacterium RIFCSPHIGHO2_12_FULL_32_22]
MNYRTGVKIKLLIPKTNILSQLVPLNNSKKHNGIDIQQLKEAVNAYYEICKLEEQLINKI